jgi:hypothetical protein
MMIWGSAIYTGFLLTWGLTQFWSAIEKNAQLHLSLWFFLLVYVGVFGVVLPLYLAQEFDFSLHCPVASKRMLAGTIVLLLVTVTALFGSS